MMRWQTYGKTLDLEKKQGGAMEDLSLAPDGIKWIEKMRRVS